MSTTEEINNIKNKISQMSNLVFKMWQDTHTVFMEHDRDLISAILDDENKLNLLEKEITQQLIDLKRLNQETTDIKKIISYIDIVGDLELIGDYCKDVLERIEIKIEEKLLFSEEAVKEYNELYYRIEEILKQLVQFLEKGFFEDALKGIIEQKKSLLHLASQIRKHHDERLLSGKCSPLASNMFLNIVDFTLAVYNHIENIVRSLKKVNP